MDEVEVPWRFPCRGPAPRLVLHVGLWDVALCSGYLNT